MKRFITVSIIICVAIIRITAMAQNNVGVGTNTPDASAKIDITSANKGLLIPRIALTGTTDAATIPSPATSLLIYNTATAGSSPNNVTPGFYYNSGTSASPVWTKLSTATSPNEWSLAGNTGISEPATPSVYGTSVIGATENFLGTTDIKDLTFGTNDIERMRIKSSSGNVGIGTANPTAKLEVANADAKVNTLTIGKGGGSQFENTAIGADALQFNTSSGDQNTAIGFRVLNINNTGRLNTASGAYTLKNNTTGSYNTGFGTGSLINNSTGNGNIGIGFNAMAANTTGSYNTVIGHFSNVGSNDLSNATAIGSNAMVRSNNSLILGDTINNVRVGIGTTSPDNSTVLDIISSSKGVRLPNIALTSTTDGATVSSPVTSLLIYNTATVSDVTPGFYYNSNTPVSPIWTRLNTSTTLDTLGWTKALTSSTKAAKADNQYVTGNIGLGDFSAAAPLDKIHVKGNLRIDSGRIDFRNTGQSVFVGEGAGINDDFAARSNVAIGYNSLNQNTTGNNNVAIGTGALEKNTASFNTAVGRRALNSVTTGYTNAAFGESTLRASTTGFENTAFGQASLRFNVTGNRNTVVGSAAGYNNTGSANIFFGYQAGFNETGNNKLYIENSNSATPLIYGDFANNHITINDSLTSKYFQMTNGAANGFVLRSDATGNSTWTNPATLISDTASWTKALTTTTKATKTDNQYVTGKVGIGDFSSSSPSANLHVIGNGIIGSSSNTVTGINSLATGNGNTLSGNYSFTTGQFNNNAAENSITSGILTRIESGYGHSIAVGYTDTLAASAAVVFGFGNKVTGFEGFAAGDRNKVTGQTAVAFGSSNNSNGNNSFVLGENNNAASLNEVTLGMNGTTYSASSISTYNATDRILNVGNGVNSSTRSDAFTILKNGNIGVNNSTPNTSAILDINSASKGVRMPNVALTSTTDAATIATPATSLLIYNTATAGVSPNNVTPGFYYNSNTSVSPIWTRLNTSAVVDTLGWTKALTTNTSASKSDNQYVTGKVGIGDFSASTPNANIQVIGNGNIGAGNTISGSNSLVTGNGNTLSGNYSIATGQFNYNAAENSIIAGYFSRIESGYGHSISVGYADTIAASSAAVFGVGNKVTAYEGFAAGDKNKVSGQTAAAFGGSNNATASNAFVTGGRNTVSASNAFAAGNNNIANGNNSFVNGSDNTASSFSETAIGLYGTNYTPNSTTIYNATDRVLNVGNGVNSSTRSDAFTILKNGNIGVNNSTPNSSAILDITATNKGVRLPNVALTSTTDAATIATPATSLLIYNTATAGISPNNVTPGFYYNSNTSVSPIWSRLNTNNTEDTLGWTKALTSNTKATKSDNQYVTGNIGVGDFSSAAPNDKIHVKGNLRIDSGRIDFRNTGQSVFVGEGAGINDDLATRSNVAIGYNSLNQSITGNNNVAIGTGALEKNTASFNTAVGRNALNSVTTGYTNAAFGESTLRASTTGFENTAFGQASLRFNITGNRNTVVGSAAGYNNTGSANIFFGYQAGFNETGNNKLYIENSSSATPLIYGDFASNHITINDSLTSKYFQMTNGAANNFVLRSDASGNATWASIASLDTTSWTKALTTNASASKSDNQYVTGKVGIGDFSASTPNANIQVIGNGNIGTGNTISGTNSFVTGFNNTVTGTQAFATGGGNNVSGNYSVALNNTNTTTSSATTSIVGGYQSYVSSNIGLAIGYNDTTTAQAAAAFGFDNNAAGANSFAAGGASNIASGANSLATGSNNTVTATQAFAAGGNNNAAGVNSFVAGGTNNNVSGNNSFVTGFNNTVTGTQAFAVGGGNNVAGNYSVALNNSNTTTNTATTSLVGGYQSYVTSNIGLAIGQNDTTTGQAAAAFGFDNNAAGANSFVAGTDNVAASYSETALGINGTRYTPASATTYNATDRIFNVGNGASASNRADAFTILKNGNIGVNNNTPNSSAILDILSINKGVRLPNVPLTSAIDAAAISAPALSLLIYNTEFDGVAPNNVVPGYYYNSGTPASPKWSRFVTSTDSIGWIKALSSSTKAIKTDNQYVTGNIGIGDFSAITPSNNISFTQGANKTIGAERSTTAGTYYNLTVQAGGAMAGQNNNHGGDLILSGGTATGNGGSVSDLGSNVIFKTATPLGSSSSADQTPTEKVRIKGDGTVNVATMAGTGNRTVIVDANGNLSASKNMVYVEDRAERTTDATNSGFRSIGSSTGNLAVNTGDVVAITLTLKFKWTGGTGTDQARFGINITGCTTATVTDTYEKEDADDVNRNQYQPFSAQYIYTATCNGNLQFNLLMDSNSNADDNAKTGDVVIVARKL